jgi:hypothetical protein
MKLSHLAPILAAALGLAAAAAQAAAGFQVTKEQEALIKPGMSTDEVQRAIGRPSIHMKYRNEPGLTYTYRVLGSDPMLFDVDFDAGGRVASVMERMDESTGGGGGARHGGRR